MKDVFLRSGERMDDLQYDGYRLIQNPSLFCFSTDAVLLSAFVRIPRDSRVLDLGAGNGILTVLMYSRVPQAHYAAVEIQRELYDLLVRNLRLNRMMDVQAVHGDLRDAPKLFGTHNDICVCNPPYEKAGSGRAARSRVADGARRETLVTFEEIVHSASALLRTGGRFYIVHRSARLAELMSALRAHRLEPKVLQLVTAVPGREPKTCLIMAQKDAAEGMRVLPELTLFTEDGAESTRMKQIYRRED